MHLKKLSSSALFGAVMCSAALGVAFPAHALDLSPATAGAWTTLVNSNLSASEVEALVGAPAGSLGLVYKADYDMVMEDGPAQNYYDTSWALEDMNDPSGATITQTGLLKIACPSCYLVVKDGNQTPAQYLFDISAWNGTDDIELFGFWEDPAQGAISNIAIWNAVDGGGGGGGTITPIPEAETYAMMLAGLGLVGFVARRRLRV